MFKRLWKGWKETSDRTYCICADNCYDWFLSPTMSRANHTTGHVVQHSRSPRSWTGTFLARCAQSPWRCSPNRLDLCIQGLFGAGKSKSMAVLILALLELDTTNSLKILFICKENSGTRSFADLLLWLDPPSVVLGRIGRLVADQERNKSSYSHTKFDINPRERRQMLSKCQLVMATGGTIVQDLTMQWSTLGGFMQDLSLLVIDEGQQYGTDREIAVISLLKQQPPCPVDRGLVANTRGNCPGSSQCQKVPPAPAGQETWTAQ